MKTKNHLILHNIRSEYNVGAIFRTADAVGIHTIFLTGYTPAPIDRFGREVGSISKTALGAEKTVKWKKGDIVEVINKLQNINTTIVAVEQAENSVDYKNFTPTKDTAFILGDEVHGIEDTILKQTDTIIEIPMKGTKESLNVSVTAGVVLYRVLNI